jgi:hypothetical protein
MNHFFMGMTFLAAFGRNSMKSDRADFIRNPFYHQI